MYSLGIEFSTQSVKLVVLHLKAEGLVYNGTFDYDECFPEYETRGGVLPSDNPDIRHTSPLMLIEALDYAFRVMQDQGVDLSLTRIIKVDAMQHCTVYINRNFRKRIQNLDYENTLAKQLEPCLTRQTSPIWEDRSPVMETGFLNDSLKSHGGIMKLTGNRAERRFPAAQILKWAGESPQAYQATSNIFALSAFITSILTGSITPVDTGDGWGTNLNSMDIHQPGWSREVLSVVDEYLKVHGATDSLSEKIGSMDHYDSHAGTINPYFAQKYGLNPETLILTGTGDNPASLLGCGGSIMISLGSSYTVCGVMDQIIPSSKEEYNIFGYTPGTAMALSVFTNGGKVHKEFMRRYLHSPGGDKPERTDWDAYVKMAGEVSLSDDERLMLPYLFNESVPLRERGIVRDHFSEDDNRTNIRALHLSQVVSLKTHSSHMGEVEELCLVAGGAANSLLRQWIADAFNARTYSIRNADVAAPFGCALSGAAKVLGLSYREATERYVQKDLDSVCKPIAENIGTMERLVQKYRDMENNHPKAN